MSRVLITGLTGKSGSVFAELLRFFSGEGVEDIVVNMIDAEIVDDREQGSEQ